MVDILTCSFFIALFTCSVYYLSLHSYPLYPYRLLWYKVLGIKYNRAKDENEYPSKFIEYLSKPIITCPPCMCSIYGIALSFFLHYSGFVNDLAILEVVFYALSVFVAGGINRIITQLI